MAVVGLWAVGLWPSMMRFAGEMMEVMGLVMAKKVTVDHGFEENFVESETMPDSNAQDLSGNGKDDHEPISPSSKRDSIKPCKVMKVVEKGQKSQKKRDYLTHTLKKLHCELLTMDDESDEIENDDDLEGAHWLQVLVVLSMEL
ncbi:hypothetical protein RHMOL_Rhmol04G0035200 [Rhododendron molle]|uniref:Uncharacterized protein n=1 Tax=Rhododendron molle TaxID=49168 RepID=A0ACC0NWQ8_RHOML|nr:hypothetical protein RHMOL_Rhmol04G0035200 [Rhododendron molle]